MLRPGERAVAPLGGAEVKGWRPGCSGACERLRSCVLLRQSGLNRAHSAPARVRAELPARAAALLALGDVAPESPA